MSLPVVEESDTKVRYAEPTHIDETDLFPYEETDDPNHRAHYVNPPLNLHIWRPGMTTQEVVDIARLTDQELVALCGYRWVPKHNPTKFEVCEKCAEIVRQMIGDEL